MNSPKHNQTQTLQKIFDIQDIIIEYFKNDILIATKNHSYQGYVFPHKKQFVCASKKLKFLKSKELMEIRFLCGMECVQKTHHVLSFFEKCFAGCASPVFVMVPYFYQNPSEDEEYLISYQFKFEVNLKYFPKKNKIYASFFGYKDFDRKDILIKRIKKILRKKDDVLCAGKLNPHDDNPKLRVKSSSNLGLSVPSLSLAPQDFLPKHHINSAILSMMEHMKKGECYLANITHTHYLQHSNGFFEAKLFLIKWFTKKSTFGFYFMCAEHDVGLESFSPERFLIKRGNKVATQPIKGTQKISKPILWKKKKEMYEHSMAVDLLRHDLNSVCVPGSVVVQEPFYIKRTQSILQMESTIVGLLPAQDSCANLMTKMIPGGSITGTPKKRTCELISRYESNTRGYYTGIAGIVETSQNFDFAILIRSLFKGRRGIYTGVGAGITTLSCAQEEFEEFCLKLRSFL